jgi:hypothetical protein
MSTIMTSASLPKYGKDFFGKNGKYTNLHFNNISSSEFNWGNTRDIETPQRCWN